MVKKNLDTRRQSRQSHQKCLGAPPQKNAVPIDAAQGQRKRLEKNSGTERAHDMMHTDPVVHRKPPVAVEQAD